MASIWASATLKRTQPFSVALWMNTPHHKERTVVFSRSKAWTDAGSRGYQMLLATVISARR